MLHVADEGVEPDLDAGFRQDFVQRQHEGGGRKQRGETPFFGSVALVFPIRRNVVEAVADAPVQQFLGEPEGHLIAVAVAERLIEVDKPVGGQSAHGDGFFDQRGFATPPCGSDGGGNPGDPAPRNDDLILFLEHDNLLFSAECRGWFRST
ncbi:hypothetical protein SDC9_188280 [bioreactor metagenome]|uniref:Uncharacterized protein n=1 Tax=bioreactor metagenome TaxID=1076179 RepID=A0A645HNX1_9ZZZZ